MRVEANTEAVSGRPSPVNENRRVRNDKDAEKVKKDNAESREASNNNEDNEDGNISENRQERFKAVA
jgi:hypothetical protein